MWIPASERYVDEPTLICAEHGIWHVFSNGASLDLNSWRRDANVSVGGRDPMILRTAGGASCTRLAHSRRQAAPGSALGGWEELTPALRNPEACSDSCWVLFSPDLRHSEPKPVATLKAHGGEIHEQGGAFYITHSGWPEKLANEAPGLYVTRLDW